MGDSIPILLVGDGDAVTVGMEAIAEDVAITVEEVASIAVLIAWAVVPLTADVVLIMVVVIDGVEEEVIDGVEEDMVSFPSVNENTSCMVVWVFSVILHRHVGLYYSCRKNETRPLCLGNNNFSSFCPNQSNMHSTTMYVSNV